MSYWDFGWGLFLGYLLAKNEVVPKKKQTALVKRKSRRTFRRWWRDQSSFEQIVIILFSLFIIASIFGFFLE